MKKEEAICLMEKAKVIVVDVWNETNIDEVGDVLCSIDEATNAIEEEIKEYYENRKRRRNPSI